MYLRYYKLNQSPFTLSPDPKYLYYTPSHKEALAQMTYTVSQGTGIMLLTGEVGTGKTSLVNALKLYLPKSCHVVVISHSILSPGGLIKSICRGFGIAIQDKPVEDLLFKLQEYIEWKSRLGKKAVLIIDEAQILSQDILEHVRLLSNFESMNEKYLQLILVGQPELKTKLKAETLKPLEERIQLRCQLRRLTPQETDAYIHYRLKVAGYPSTNNLFSKPVINLIHQYSHGIPRRINIFSDKALMAGYTRNKKHIG